MRIALTFALLVMTAAGCGSPPTCVVGAQELCGCEGGAVGFQTCGDEGTFSKCTCPDACEPRTCGDANAQCGEADDGCGGTLACGVCAATQTCVASPGGAVCGCGTGLVLLGDTCDVNECADALDDCDANATCANTVGAFTCACAAGYAGNGTTCDVDECAAGTDNCDDNAACVDAQPGFSCLCNTGYLGDGVDCAADPATFVADLDATPIDVSIGGVGALTVRGLGRISLELGFTRVVQGNDDRPVATALNSTPAFTLSRVRGAPAAIDSLRALGDSGASTSITVLLDNIAFGEAADVVVSAATIEVTDATVTPVGPEAELAALVVRPTVVARLQNVVGAPAVLLPQPQNALMLEISGITGDSTIFSRYVSAELPAWTVGPGGLVTVHQNRELAAIWVWTSNFLDGLFDYRAMSRIELNANNQELGRRNCYEGMPVSFVVFDPTRSYRTTLLSNVVIAVSRCENG